MATKANECPGCNKPVSGKVITALNRKWHLDHFVCGGCQQPLGSKAFYERDGKPFCDGCYQGKFAPVCAHCSKPVTGKCMTALNQQWHPEHFVCNGCQKPFGEGMGFMEKDKKPYCQNCFYGTQGTTKCGGCSQSITSSYLTALDKQWHQDCFVCQVCRKDFGGGSFYDHEGQPYCEQHYFIKTGAVCSVCNMPVTGRCLTALGRKWHPEHFNCTGCSKELSKGSFAEHDNNPYCADCSSQMFG